MTVNEPYLLLGPSLRIGADTPRQYSCNTWANQQGVMSKSAENGCFYHFFDTVLPQRRLIGPQPAESARPYGFSRISLNCQVCGPIRHVMTRKTAKNRGFATRHARFDRFNALPGSK